MPRILRGGSRGRPPTPAPTARPGAPAPGGSRSLPPAAGWSRSRPRSAPALAVPAPEGSRGRPPTVGPRASSAPSAAAPAPGGGSGSRPLTVAPRTVAPQAGAPPSAASLAPSGTEAGGLWLCHRGAPSAPHARIPRDIKTLAKFISSASVTSVSIFLVHLPFLHYLAFGNLELTACIWDTEGLQIGLMNALMWLLYGASVYKRDGGPDVILSCAWSSAAMLCCLLLVCAYSRKLHRASFWYLTTMATVVVALIILQLEPVGELLSSLERVFGWLGNVSLLLTHFAQIWDLIQATKQAQLASALLTIAPSSLIAFQQFTSVFVKGTSQSKFMKLSCWINGVGYPIEMVITCLMTRTILYRNYRAFRARVVLRSFTISSFVQGDANSTEDDEFSDYGEAMQILFGTEIKFVDLNLNDKESKVMVNLGAGSFGMEISRVFGGGILPGSLILVRGDPGVGKSTLMLQIASNMVDESSPVVYASSEESIEQIGNRARRMNITSNHLYLYSGTDLEDALDKSLQVSPRALIVDSIQTFSIKSTLKNSGSFPQVKENAIMLFQFAMTTNIPVFLIGNVTKTGDIAMHLFLEQIVDVLLHMEGEGCSSHRLLRPVKNQFGPTNELGVFEMTEFGLKVVLDPRQLFLVDHESDSETPARLAIAVILQGSRTFVVAVQASCAFGSYIRQVVGITENRADAIISILIKQGLYKLQDNAVFINVLGGFKFTESAGDLAIAASLWSSFSGFAIPNNVAFIGKVGIGGELRNVPRIEKRVMDITKMGFKICVVPKASEKLLKQINVDMEIVACSNLKQVVNTMIRPQS